MLASYRLGTVIVAGVILVSGVFTLAFVPSTPRQGPAGQDLGSGAYPIGPFHLTERSGREVSESDLSDGVWIASFLFSRCPSSCPKLTEEIRKLQDGPLQRVPVRFVSISVDPEHDTPTVLSAYAKTRGADPDRWWFLTGPKAVIYDMILGNFHLPVAENPQADPKAGMEAVAHSDKLALVDRGNRVVGFFSSTDPAAIRDLINRAKQLSGLAIPWVRRLPSLNASLNGSCAVLLAVGLTLIRSGRSKGHALCMALAVTVSAIFLGSYLLYHYHVGSVAFRGYGPIRFTYFTILISHTVLATFGVVPLVAITLTRSLRRQFPQHARIARVTFPIWMYVSITGVVIYWMLYRLDMSASALGG